MTIGFDGSRAFSNNRTGTENYSYQLLKNLAKIDHKNEYIVYLRPKRHPELVSESAEMPKQVRHDIKSWPDNFQFKTINWLRLWTQAGLAAQTFKDGLDLLFIPAHTSPLIHKPGLKTVVTVHDLGAEYLPKMHQLKQTLYLKWVTNFQLKNATKLIAVSKATKMDLIKKVKINPKKIEVIYEGYDEEKFKNDVQVNKQSLRTFDTEVLSLIPYFLFVGTIQPRKNLERIIRAFSLITRNDSLKLVIAGSKGWLADEIYNLPKELGIEKRVKFLGYVKDEDLPSLYANASALIFPSLFEGFGLPIIEAQACGCPVITSNISSMPEIAGKGAILVNPLDIDDIVKGMTRIMNSESRIKIIKAGFENIKRFSWEKCARETLKVLESV